MIPRGPVAITGLGAVSCLGQNVNELWSNAIKGHSGIVNGLGHVSDLAFANLPDSIRGNRALALGWLSGREAVQQAGWDLGTDKIGLIVATTTGQLLLWDSVFMSMARGEASLDLVQRAFHNQPLSKLMDGLHTQLGFRQQGTPRTLITSACSASTQAIGLAAMWIRSGRVKRCLVLGVEVLTDLTTEGFRCLQLLSTERARPFAVDRRGINLSEAGAALCLEAISDNQAPLAYLSGFGFSTDGYHMTGPHPEGDGCYRAMRAALAAARLRPEQVDWVYAHGTGSQLNDVAEGLAIQRLFGENSPWVSSTKSLHGHPLAAAGALESVLLVQAMQHQVLLATPYLRSPDPGIPIRHPFENLSMPLRNVMKSTLGFGGTNAALVFSRERLACPA